MSYKTPKKLRSELTAARSRLELLIGVLDQNSDETHWGLGKEFKETADSLRRLLDANNVPLEYKVAVIGRFKAGKSSFVNEMLGQRLAGEDTTPETAAVTTFRHGERVRAKINFIDKQIWVRLKEIYSKEPTDPDAHRIARWYYFGKERAQNSEKATERFDLAKLEGDYILDGGHTITIELVKSTDPKDQKKRETEFRNNIKTFTSGSKPHHCLVESIEIETPSILLGEGVTLVDTPGLDDTERYRVNLTERAVENVDAVLFLTKSGAAYGQSEKDFLLTLLRKGTVKQLVFVITQVDQTYEQHFRQARDQEEEPQEIAKRIEIEKRRIRLEIEATLDELDKAGTSAPVQRYREQLSAIEIAFTSAANHRDSNLGETVRFPIAHGDPGGMAQVKATLFKILSTESLLATARLNIQTDTQSILKKMLEVVENRRSAVRNLKNREVAENKLANFRSEFSKIGDGFGEIIQTDSAVLKVSLKNRLALESLAAENIALHADGVLASYETDDAGRHWKTRRGGNWGYMRDLQTRVANAIFPKVAEQLGAQTEHFNSFVEAFRIHLQALSDEAEVIAKRLNISDELHFDLAGGLERFLNDSLLSLQELIAGEESKIVSLLENFVDDEVEDKISNARTQVANIWGRGTTNSQTQEVRGFYKSVKAILRNALSQHVMHRFSEFARHLIAQAEALPNQALSSVRTQIEQASADIRAAAEAAVAGQKESFERLADEIFKNVNDSLKDISDLLGEMPSDEPPVSRNVTRLPENDSPKPGVSQNEVVLVQLDNNISEQLRESATNFIARHRLNNGENGWTFERIFAQMFVAGATEAWLIDPYLALPHQRRNLTEFCTALFAATSIKTLHIKTKAIDTNAGQQDPEFFSSLDQSAYAHYGTKVGIAYDDELHDRFVVFNNGCVFKLGRGLDIYKPSLGLAKANPKLRKVRECEIDIFMPPGY